MSNILTRIQGAALRLLAQKDLTLLTVSDLAQAAGLARGTIYNQVGAPHALFEAVATRLASEMAERVGGSLAGLDDPAQRLAGGIRHFVRRAHDEPDWGRFLVRFSLSTPSLHALLVGGAAEDVRRGMAAGRFSIAEDRVASTVALLGGAVVAAIGLVVDGHRTWREAAGDVTELVLRGLGIPPDEARRLAGAEPPLAEPPARKSRATEGGRRETAPRSKAGPRPRGAAAHRSGHR